MNRIQILLPEWLPAPVHDWIRGIERHHDIAILKDIERIANHGDLKGLWNRVSVILEKLSNHDKEIAYRELSRIIFFKGGKLPEETNTQRAKRQTRIAANINKLCDLLDEEPMSRDINVIRLLEFCSESSQISDEAKTHAKACLGHISTENNLKALVSWSSPGLNDLLRALGESFTAGIEFPFKNVSPHIPTNLHGETADQIYLTRLLVEWFEIYSGKPEAKQVERLIGVITDAPL